MPSFSGVWNISEVFQAKGSEQWEQQNNYFILYGGLYSSANSFSTGLSSAADGTIVSETISSNTSLSQASFFDKNGKNITNKKYPVYQTPAFIDNTDINNPVFYLRAPTAYSINAVRKNSANTYIFGNSLQGGGPNNLIESNQVGVTSNGIIAIQNSYRVGTSTDYPTIGLYDLQGTFIDARAITANGPPSALGQYAKLFPRTDNAFTYIRATGSAVYSWTVSTTSAIPTDNKTYSGGSGSSEFRSGVMDSNNVLYMVGMRTAYSEVEMIRINSSRVPTHCTYWNLTVGSYSGYDNYNQYVSSIAQYGNYVYVAKGAYTGTPRVGYWFVVCLNAADLTFAWGKSFTSSAWNISGANAYTGALGGSAADSYMTANQYGVWVQWGAGTATAADNQTYLMKLPLDGKFQNGTYTVNGKSIVVADYTPTLTSVAVPSSLATTTPTTTSRTAFYVAPPSNSQGNNPNPVKTTLIG